MITNTLENRIIKMKRLELIKWCMNEKFSKKNEMFELL